MRVLHSATRASVSAYTFELPADCCLLVGEYVCTYLTWVQVRFRVCHTLMLMTVHKTCFISTKLQIQQDRQYSINVTLMRVRVRETIVVLQKQEVLHILSLWRSLSSPEQSARAVLYCHLWRLQLNRIFPHYLINGTIF